MLKSNFDWLRDAFDRLIIAISNYVEFLRRQRGITATNHASDTPVRMIDQATTVKIYKQNVWVTSIDKNKYYHLIQLLTDLPPWKPVDIEDIFPPVLGKEVRMIFKSFLDI